MYMPEKHKLHWRSFYCLISYYNRQLTIESETESQTKYTRKWWVWGWTVGDLRRDKKWLRSRVAGGGWGLSRPDLNILFTWKQRLSFIEGVIFYYLPTKFACDQCRFRFRLWRYFVQSEADDFFLVFDEYFESVCSLVIVVYISPFKITLDSCTIPDTLRFDEAIWSIKLVAYMMRGSQSLGVTN